MADSVVYAVSELTELIKRSLETSFSYLAVEGEISNWRPAPSGHVYFTLKDGAAMLQAVMFKGKAQRLGFQAKDGMLVRASGGLSVYAARGQYQLIVDSMALAGEGDILALLEERKRRLAAEGLFDQDRKRPIPAFPSRVAVITSPTGAAVRDILNVLKRRNAGLRITLLPSLVQGEDAPAMLVQQLRIANEQKLGDVIIIGRGGGSLEDLLAFSDEALVRAVAASTIPVISAVGHEIDWSLCDFAADLRAPTPSAAAELVSESASAIRSRVADAAYALENAMRARLDRARLVIRGFAPEALELRLERCLQPSRQRFDDAKEELVRGIRDALRASRHRLERAYSLLCAADPSAILARGFAVVRKEGGGRAIRHAEELIANDTITIDFARGSARAITQEIQP
ncbi:MAG TPA: exodeoxyribonuclease VII large subunit [Spirochaetaceae bacterium]|nr:exodeoxyribonuclease VII large subunit [Spirochaetaceae bacterium]